MKRLVLKVLGIAALAATTGCATSVYRVSESVPAVSQMPASRNATRKPVAAVWANAADDKAAGVAKALQAAVEADLNARGFDIGTEDPADSEVAMTVACREKARLDEWRVDEGTAEVRVSEGATGKLLGVKSFTAAGQRTLDEAQSATSVGAGLSGQVLPWLAKTLVARKIPLAPSGLAVMMLTICPDDVMADPSEALAVQRRFMDVVAARPGVKSCRLDREVPASRSFVFRVEYEPQSFPGGLLNTIVLENPHLGEAELKIVR